MRKPVGMLLAAWLLAGCAGLMAQAAAPRNYSLTETNSLFVPGMTVRVYREGFREVIDKSIAPHPGDPGGYHTRTVYDFRAHTVSLEDMKHPESACAREHYRSRRAPPEFDPVTAGAGGPLGALPVSGRPARAALLHGMQAQVETVPLGDGLVRVRIWRARRLPILLKAVVIDPEGRRRTLFEVRRLRLGRLSRPLPKLDHACIAVSGTTSAQGGRIVLRLPPGAPAHRR